LFQAEPRDRADDLDHLDLLAACGREDDVERRLLLGSGTVTPSRGSARRRDGDRSSGGDPPLVLDLLLQLHELEPGHLAQLVERLVGRASGHYWSSCSVCVSVSVASSDTASSAPVELRGSGPLASASEVSPCSRSCSMRASMSP